MTNKNSMPMRVDPQFDKMLKKINLERIKQGKSNEMLSPRRLTKAITRIPHIEEFIIKSRIENDRKKK